MKIKRQSFETDAPTTEIARALGAAWRSNEHRAKFPIREINGGYRLATDHLMHNVDYSVVINDDGDRRTVTTQLHSASAKRDFSVFLIPLSPKRITNPSAYYGVMATTRTSLEEAGHQVVNTTVKVAWP